MLTISVVVSLFSRISGLSVSLGSLLLELRQAPLRQAPLLLRLVVGVLVARHQRVVVPQPPARALAACSCSSEQLLRTQLMHRVHAFLSGKRTKGPGSQKTLVPPICSAVFLGCVQLIGSATQSISSQQQKHTNNPETSCHKAWKRVAGAAWGLRTPVCGAWPCQPAHLFLDQVKV